MSTASGPSVLYLIDSLAAGGAERSFLEIAPHLCDRGLQLTAAVLIDRAGLAPELEAAGIPVRLVGGDRRLTRIARLSAVLRSEHPDLLHTTLFEADIVGRFAAAITGTAVVSTLASTPYGLEHAAEPGIRRTRLRAAQALDAVSARLARRFHAVSEPVAKAYISRLRLDPSKVEVIPRGRDLSRLGEATDERRLRTRTSLGIAETVPVLLFAGRHEPAKGLDVLVEGFLHVLSDRPDSLLLVAGREGKVTETARRLVSDKEVGHAVRFLGERSDVPDLLCASDLFMLPSYREGLPGAVLEAMALGVPVVASDIPAVREAIPGEDYGYLVPPGDSGMLGSVASSALRERSGSRAKARRARERFDSRFNIQVVADEMTQFYRRALRTGATSS